MTAVSDPGRMTNFSTEPSPVREKSAVAIGWHELGDLFRNHHPQAYISASSKRRQPISHSSML